MTRSTVDVLVVGAGKAGSQLAVSLRDEGFEGSILLAGDEPEHPYDRPPLSKGHLLGDLTDDQILLRESSHYLNNRIDIGIGQAVTSIDAGARTAVVDGRPVAFGDLVLATGALPRALPVPGADFDGVTPLRTLAHSRLLRGRLATARSVVVIGGGFVGLEVAAVAATNFGCRVTVLEALPRLLARTALPATADYVASYHRSLGVDVQLNTLVTAIEGENGVVTGVTTSAGSTIPADVVVYGIGVVPRTELAAAAGIEVANGILVDRTLQTSAEHIWAIGDCAAFPSPDSESAVRLESVQNATDQARFLARELCTGVPSTFRAIPWFWSDQAQMLLQSVGLTTDHDETVVIGDPAGGSFSTLAFRSGRLLGGDSVNTRSDHLGLRRLLGRQEREPGFGLSVEEARRTAFSLKEFARRESSGSR